MRGCARRALGADKRAGVYALVVLDASGGSIHALADSESPWRQLFHSASATMAGARLLLPINQSMTLRYISGTSAVCRSRVWAVTMPPMERKA